MKRRKFIQSSLVAGAAAAAPVGAAAIEGTARVFGEPASLTGGTANVTVTKMLLPLSRGGMPAEGWDRWSRLSAAVVQMFSDPAQRGVFNSDPQKFLATVGYDARVLDAPTLSLLVALSAPEVQSAVHKKDYASLSAIFMFPARWIGQSRMRLPNRWLRFCPRTLASSRNRWGWPRIHH